MNIRFNFPALAVAVFMLASLGAATAQVKDHVTKTEIVAASELTAGEVRKVDKPAGKITLKHEDIRNLDMPGMTMVFPVRDVALLEKFQSGDKVRFRAEKAGDAIVVTRIERAN